MNPDWQTELSTVITDPIELAELLQIELNDLLNIHKITRDFALRVPRSFVHRMQKNNLHDPLLLQVLPQADELQIMPGYTQDALNEQQYNPVPGVLHKYFGRVLLTLSGGCAIHCRYCFRRHFSYADNRLGKKNFSQTLDYLAQDPSIHEVILSGGDPLIIRDQQLDYYLTKLAQIPHLQRLRIHTRLPIVIPSRITTELVNLLTKTRLQPVIVLHCNHPQEINTTVSQALQPLRAAKITLLNQSVLLKNINDQAETLIQLSQNLFSGGILPYYLHLLDKVSGTGHFDVVEDVAKNLHWQMMQKLPGYLVPRLVREQPGFPCKKLIV